MDMQALEMCVSVSKSQSRRGTGMGQIDRYSRVCARTDGNHLDEFTPEVVLAQLGACYISHALVNRHSSDNYTHC